MAAIGISEFTFGYAFLYEQTHVNPAVPRLPDKRRCPSLSNYRPRQASFPSHRELTKKLVAVTLSLVAPTATADI
jgi:hypothetical protein